MNKPEVEKSAERWAFWMVLVVLLYAAGVFGTGGWWVYRFATMDMNEVPIMAEIQ